MNSESRIVGFSGSEFKSPKAADDAFKLGKKLLDALGEGDMDAQIEAISGIDDLSAKKEASVVFTIEEHQRSKRTQALKCLGVEIGRTGKSIDKQNIHTFCPGIINELGIKGPIENGAATAVIDTAGNMTMVRVK